MERERWRTEGKDRGREEEEAEGGGGSSPSRRWRGTRLAEHRDDEEPLRGPRPAAVAALVALVAGKRRRASSPRLAGQAFRAPALRPAARRGQPRTGRERPPAPGMVREPLPREWGCRPCVSPRIRRATTRGPARGRGGGPGRGLRRSPSAPFARLLCTSPIGVVGRWGGGGVGQASDPPRRGSRSGAFAGRVLRAFAGQAGGRRRGGCARARRGGGLRRPQIAAARGRREASPPRVPRPAAFRPASRGLSRRSAVVARVWSRPEGEQDREPGRRGAGSLAAGQLRRRLLARCGCCPIATPQSRAASCRAGRLRRHRRGCWS